MIEKVMQTVPSEEALLSATLMVEEMMEENETPRKIAMKICVVVDEVFSNIMLYSRAKMVEVGCRISEELLELWFIDDGIPYNPLETEEPDITLPAQERKMGGLGVLIYKAFMDDVCYEYRDGKNRITLMKQLI